MPCDPNNCNGPCSRRQERREPTALADAIARVVVDARVVRAALDVSKEYPTYTADDIIQMVSIMKADGRLDDYA